MPWPGYASDIDPSSQAPFVPIWRILLAGTAVCILAALYGHLRFDNAFYLYGDVQGLPGATDGFLRGAMTVVSGMLLAAAGLFGILIGRQLSQTGSTGSRAWTLAGCFLLFLAIDEILMVHEWVTEQLAELGVPKLLGIDQDIYVFVVYGLIAVALGIRLLPTMRAHRHAALPLLMVVILAAASELLDFAGAHLTESTTQLLAGLAEETLKTLATLCAACYGLEILEQVVERRVQPTA